MVTQQEMEIFQAAKEPPPRSVNAPLAETLRPRGWEEFFGLELLDKALITQLQSGKGKPPSLILWGPPGSGKTTFARLVGRSYSMNFVEFSAVLGGVKEVREIVEQAKKLPRGTLLFVDEIHRFNKAQQDAFLPHVENGTVTLIGATTENPSFALNGALLSRARVIVFPGLPEAAMAEVLTRAAAHLQISFDAAAASLFIQYAGVDARKLINLVESFSQSSADRSGSEASVRDFLKNSHVLVYDRSGEHHYNLISAFIKSMRGSDPDAALYWAFRMIESGEDPRFILRRMMIFASEDIGNADPRALQLAVATADAFDRLGLPEGRIPLAQCITYLASSPKSNRSYVAMNEVLSEIKDRPSVQVPLHLRNAPTGLLKQLGYGSDYKYPHDDAKGYVGGVQYLPDDLVGRRFYNPSQHGAEKALAERLSVLRGIKSSTERGES